MATVNPVNLQKHLKGVNYPASKQDLIEQAQSNDADDTMIDLLNQLSEEEEFQTPTEVNQAISELE